MPGITIISGGNESGTQISTSLPDPSRGPTGPIGPVGKGLCGLMKNRFGG